MWARPLAACLLAAVWLAASVQPAVSPAAAANEVYVLDVRLTPAGRETLVLLLPSRQLALRAAGQVTPLGVIALSARFLPDGNIALVDESLALRRIGAAGELVWLPPGSANAPLFLSPDGRRLAYLKPRDLPPGEHLALTNGLAILDLATGTEQVLLEAPESTLNLYGWAGDEVLFELPAQGTVLPSEMRLAAISATRPQAGPRLVAELPAAASGTSYPQTAFDQRHLAYESPAGVVVASLATFDYTVLADAAQPLWTETELTVARGAGRTAAAWTEADLLESRQASKALAWPPAASATLMPAQSEPGATNAILFYRPVAASTRVSAYYDLNRASGAWRTWYGATGTGWVYGGSYDQHSGTDYDGITGHPVYAAAPGTVERVNLYCYNTYPGGPAIFGTYVRLDHGILSDGQRYWTLYGHLLCNDVQVSEGEFIPSLPRLIALMGNTGWSTGDHLHLQVYRNSLTSSVDPYDLHVISDTPPVRTSGDVSGVVLDAQGQPLAGAVVKIAGGGIYWSAIAGSDGRYQFLNVPGGPATLAAVRGRRSAKANITVPENQLLVAPDLLTQCAAGATAADGCPALTYDGAAFVEDVTIPDGQLVAPSESLVKTWRLRNTGSSTWGSGYQLTFIGGEQLPAAPTQAALTLTAPGAETDISIALTTPDITGTVRSYWRLRNAQGDYFGPTIWLEMNVQATATGTAQAAASMQPQAGPDKPDRLAAEGNNSVEATPTCAVQPLPATTGTASFTVSWAPTGAGAGAGSFDVQYQDSGRGPWRVWLYQTPASQTARTFTGQFGHYYSFRCQASGSNSYPAAGDTATRLTLGSGQPDLHILRLTGQANPTGGVLAQVTVQNQGSTSTQDGFFVDLYLNDVPGGAGDYAGSVYLWASEPLAAGATRTLKGVIFGSGESNGTLYAQVDSVGLIAESNESNNLHTAGVAVCLAAEDAYEDDDWPTAARSITVAGSQTRNFGGPGDQDWLRLDLPAGRFYRFSTSNPSAAVDTRLSITGPNGTSVMAINDDASTTTRTSLLYWTLPASGTYYLRVDDWNPATGGCGASYTLSIADLGPGYVIRFPILHR